MITLFANKEDCCGCSACSNICPRTAITMNLDKEGFLYPKIDQSKCIECMLCKEVCSFQNGYDISENLEEPSIYAVKNKNLNIRIKSRSGGIFVPIANKVIDQDGFVYGVGYDEGFYVTHKRAKIKEEISEFQGSKYVQSDLKDIYSYIKLDLSKDKYVLFSGTPCQVAGLKSFLGGKINTEKLITIDLVCHGVPSPLVWKDYLHYCEKRFNGKINYVDFRDKNYGWASHFETIGINNKKYTSNLYTKIFQSHNVLRPACHECKYTNFKRPSDITIADFWGIDESMPEFNDNKGVSLVLVNTDKGKKYFEYVKNDIEYRKSNMNDCLQPQLQYPNKVSCNRNQFWKDYNLNGFEFIANKYVGNGIKSRLKLKLLIILTKTGLLKIIQKIHK